MNPLRRQLVSVATSSLLASRAGAATGTPDTKPLRTEGTLPALSGAVEWINTSPLSPASLRGKVVVVNFWTYSCINSLRPMPYLRAWAQKYASAGLVVLGVHTPEFEFEKIPANVHRAIKEIDVPFPVAVDSNYAVWRAFANQYWPAFYFADAQGWIRHHRFGEEQYDKSEQVIQQLLGEAKQGAVPTGLVSPRGEGTQAAPGRTPPQSGETYLGYERATNFASAGGFVRDRAHDYPAAPSLRTNQWALTGDWSVGPEHTVLNRANGRIAFRFQARDVHLVMGPSTSAQPIRFKVRVDGNAPRADHGFDTDAEGNGTITSTKLYQLVRQSANERERLFEIEFLEAGAEVYVFTFG